MTIIKGLSRRHFPLKTWRYLASKTPPKYTNHNKIYSYTLKNKFLWDNIYSGVIIAENWSLKSVDVLVKSCTPSQNIIAGKIYETGKPSYAALNCPQKYFVSKLHVVLIYVLILDAWFKDLRLSFSYLSFVFRTQPGLPCLSS